MDLKPSTLRIAYVPEHYSLPLHLALPHLLSSIPVSLHPFPSGTGAMIASLRSGEIDIAIGLTEGWVAGLGTREGSHNGGYKVVGSWVETPLRWAVVTGRGRDDLVDISGLKGGKVGISRLGSGSHIMSSVLARNHSFPQFTPITLGPFPALRAGVSPSPDKPTADADFFMWEHFTTKPFFHPPESTPLKHIGEIHTPWPSWLITASDATFPEPGTDERLTEVFKALDKGVTAFEGDKDEAVKLMGTGQLGFEYEEGDAREWLKDVRFLSPTRGVSRDVVGSVIDVLREAGVIKEEDGKTEDIVSSIAGIER